MRFLRIELVAAAALAAGLAVACQNDDAGRAGSGEAPSSEEPELECEALGYPCTWAEVDSAIVRRTLELAAEAAELLAVTSSTEAVGSLLSEEPGIGEVLGDENVVRFWLEGGRPVWIGDPAARVPETLGYGGEDTPARAHATVQQSQLNDVAGTQQSHIGKTGPERPKKKALVLSPYDWELGEHAPTVQALKDVPEYGCTDGCEITEARNSFDGSPSGVLPSYTLDGTIRDNVRFQHFFDWEQYDLIHVTTHGAEICRRDAIVSVRGRKRTATLVGAPEYCVTTLDTGIVLAWPSDYRFDGPGWVTSSKSTFWQLPSLRGAEIWVVGRNAKCASLDPDDHPLLYSRLECGPGLHLEISLSDDFFKAVYPNGLENKIVFLNACETMKEASQTLANWLVHGNPKAPTLFPSTVVIGWTNIVDAAAATSVARVFYRVLLGHATDFSFLAQDAAGTLRTVTIEAPPDSAGRWPPAWAVSQAADSTVKLLPVETRGLLFVTPYGALPGPAGTPASSGGPTLSSAAAGGWGLQGRPQMRAREIVSLADPITEEQLEDDGLVMTSTAMGDGRPDSLPLVFVVHSVLPGQRPQDYRLRLHVDGTRMDVDEGLDPGDVRGVVGVKHITVPLGRALAGPTRSDFEVWVELPENGGVSRWVYEDVEIVGPEIAYSGYLNGRFEGTVEPTVTVLPNVNPNVDPNIACIVLFGATDGTGQKLLNLGASLTGPLRVGSYPITGPKDVPFTTPDGSPATRPEQPLDTFSLRASAGCDASDCFLAQSQPGEGAIRIESITYERIRASFRSTARVNGFNSMTVRGSLIASVDGLSRYADLDACLTPGP